MTFTGHIYAFLVMNTVFPLILIARAAASLRGRPGLLGLLVSALTYTFAVLWLMQAGSRLLSVEAVSSDLAQSLVISGAKLFFAFALVSEVGYYLSRKHIARQPRIQR